jgi:hypothetical protein
VLRGWMRRILASWFIVRFGINRSIRSDGGEGLIVLVVLDDT